ncbi:SGCZ protein, partial [Polypterus senegalus]
MEAPKGVEISADAGDFKATCRKEMQLQSTEGELCPLPLNSGSLAGFTVVFFIVLDPDPDGASVLVTSLSTHGGPWKRTHNLLKAKQQCYYCTTNTEQDDTSTHHKTKVQYRTPLSPHDRSAINLPAAQFDNAALNIPAVSPRNEALKTTMDMQSTLKRAGPSVLKSWPQGQ